MSIKFCPNCGLTNPASAQRCDCGFHFGSGQVGPSDLSQKKGAKLAQRAFVLALCSFFCLGFILAPAALSTAAEARHEQLSKKDSDKVYSAQVIASIVLALWALVILFVLNKVATG